MRAALLLLLFLTAWVPAWADDPTSQTSSGAPSAPSKPTGPVFIRGDDPNLPNNSGNHARVVSQLLQQMNVTTGPQPQAGTAPAAAAPAQAQDQAQPNRQIAAVPSTAAPTPNSGAAASASGGPTFIAAPVNAADPVGLSAPDQALLNAVQQQAGTINAAFQQDTSSSAMMQQVADPQVQAVTTQLQQQSAALQKAMQDMQNGQ